LRNSKELRIQDNEKQFSKIPKVTYNEFKNSLERDPGRAFSDFTIPTKWNWWGTKSLSKMLFMVWYHDIITNDIHIFFEFYYYVCLF